MDPTRFDRLAVALAARPSRRGALGALAGGLLGGLLAPLGARRAAAGDRVAGESCTRDGQCTSGICRRGRCRCDDGRPPCRFTGGLPVCCGEGFTCQDRACVPHCANGRKDVVFQESDVDCGGPDCPKCDVGKRCFDDGDCATGVCGDNFKCLRCREDAQCPPPFRSDLPFCVRNHCAECRTDADCRDPDRPRCGETVSHRACLQCLGDGDCPLPNHGCRAADGTCVPHCRDGKKDFDESDVDCGGLACERCPNGKRCNNRADCASGRCKDGRCQACTRDEQCGGEKFCDGGVCQGCPGGQGAGAQGTCGGTCEGVSVCSAADPNTARCERGGETPCFCLQTIDGRPMCADFRFLCTECNANVDRNGFCHPEQGQVCCPSGQTCVACTNSNCARGTACARPCPNA